MRCERTQAEDKSMSILPTTAKVQPLLESEDRIRFETLTVREIRDIANFLDRNGVNRVLDTVEVNVFLSAEAAREVAYAREGIQGEIRTMDAIFDHLKRAA